MTTSVETSKRPRVRVADAFPELLAHLPEKGGLRSLSFVRLTPRQIKSFLIVAECQQELSVLYHYQAGCR